MSREDPQMKIRLPEELKARIDTSATQAGRSLNAEIVARLEGSYRTDNDSFKRDLETQVAAVLARVDTLALRVDLIKSRMDNLFTRAHLISSETERMTRDAQTDEDFAKAKARFAEYDEVQAEAAALGEQAKQVIAERDAELQRMNSLQAVLKAYREKLEVALAKKPKP